MHADAASAERGPTGSGKDLYRQARGRLRTPMKKAARRKPGGFSGTAKGVIVDQRAGNAVADRTGLAGLAAAVHVDHDVEGFDMVGQVQGLLADHDRGFATEEGLDVTVVDRDLASAFFDEHTGDA